MNRIKEYQPDLLSLVRRRYADWNSFEQPQFKVDEINYKREASAAARELLSKEALGDLLDAEEYEAFIGQLKTVANKTNLLFMGVPQKGDLALINQPDSDQGAICRAIFDLLHGAGSHEERLARFFDFVSRRDLPQKWTFPTYYLFLLYPETEIFVKPSIMRWFSKALDGAVPYSSKPNATEYVEMRTAFHTLLEELRAYVAEDMIDVQSFVWVASAGAKREAKFEAVVERLRKGLDELGDHGDLVQIEKAKDVVIGRFGSIFSVDNLPQMGAEEFTGFLRYENNQHWKGINRYGSRLVQDLPRLREALALVQDESQPLAERFDEVRGSVKGLGKAVLTPILLVTHPEAYGVWNGKSEGGLRELGIYPEIEGKATEGELYAAINVVLTRLAADLEIDLWTLDTLWEWLLRQAELAEPFATIFENRGQAEWAFELLAETIDRVGGGEDDERLALTIRHQRSMLRLNFGNFMLQDFSKTKGTMDLALLIEPMESHYKFKSWGAFASDSAVAVYEIPLEIALEWPPELQAIYKASMDHIGDHFRGWKRSPYRKFHQDDVFEALFDEEKREKLLRKGIKDEEQETRYWLIALPSDLQEDFQGGRGSYNFWADCVKYGVAAIGFDDSPEDPQISKFAGIASGDWVVAFLRNKMIGGTGLVTSEMDESLEQERPADQDYFRGHFWRRIGVEWEVKNLSVEELPPAVQNKFGQATVMEMSEDEFEAVSKAMRGEVKAIKEGPSLANEFSGFTADAFAFMADLQANNNKEWMQENHKRWTESVREPMRALFADLGPALKEKFDRHLAPDALEIRPTAHQVMARINKNWSATPDSLYHEYFWGAFYREGYTRQSDAQLFITLYADVVRFGFYVGQQSKQVHEQFQSRVLEDPNKFYALLSDLHLTQEFVFVKTMKDNSIVDVPIESAADLPKWIDGSDYDLLVRLTPDEILSMGPALVDRIYEAHRRVFPLFLWTVAEDPELAVEQYLAAEFPVADVDLDDEDEPEPLSEPFTENEFLEVTHLTTEVSLELQDMLTERKQVIFYGPPGTGKTFVARHLGHLLTGLAEPPKERLEVIQFHPAYSYEDFIEGIRPESKSQEGRFIVDYPPRAGVFVRFCRQAESIEGPCVFIIDEINRGNIARIFGELMLLLEYRDLDVPLPYSGKRFRIPENVYIIGTMNTADRSIALVDFALRRRFHFFQFKADADLFDRWLVKNPTSIPYLGSLYRRLSVEAIDDANYAVGPSYFMNNDLDEQKLERIWRRSILPYLQEYHFDQPAKVKRWEWDNEFMRRIRENPDGW